MGVLKKKLGWLCLNADFHLPSTLYPIQALMVNYHWTNWPNDQKNYQNWFDIWKLWAPLSCRGLNIEWIYLNLMHVQVTNVTPFQGHSKVIQPKATSEVVLWNLYRTSGINNLHQQQVGLVIYHEQYIDYKPIIIKKTYPPHIL